MKVTVNLPNNLIKKDEVRVCEGREAELRARAHRGPAALARWGTTS